MKRRDLFTRFVTTAKVVLSAEVYNGEIEEIMGCISQSLQEPELEVQRMSNETSFSPTIAQMTPDHKLCYLHLFSSRNRARHVPPLRRSS